MDGPQTVPRTLSFQLRRGGEPTRLQSQRLAQAYERLCPIQRLTLPTAGNADPPRNPEQIAPPRVAAGGSA